MTLEMMRSEKIYRGVVSILAFIFISYFSYLLVLNTNISNSKILDSSSLFAYFGVLIGFSLTIYTFGVSIAIDVKEKIDCNKNISKEKGKKIFHKLINCFDEIKSDIWIIFFSTIIVIFFQIAEEIFTPIFPNLKLKRIPEIANLTLFIVTTFLMHDIMKSMFLVSKIRLELIKGDDNK